MVQAKSGSKKDGTALMQSIFSPRNPVLLFNAMQSRTDEDEQQGMMFLFCGAILAIRNPRAHARIVDEEDRALEYLAFLSFLANRLDRV
jgi:uncharacterized protein (TIGR02391 family)